MKSCEGETVYGCQKTGLNFLKEYPNYLLFEYNGVSGCCQPPDVVFISKDNGKEIDRIDRFQFVWGDIDENYLLYFNNTKYTELIFLDHITDERILFEFKPGVVLTSCKENNVLRTNSLFKDFELNENEFLFSFRLNDGSWVKKRISIK